LVANRETVNKRAHLVPNLLPKESRAKVLELQAPMVMKLRAMGLLAISAVALSSSLMSEPVVTRYTEGLIHGFLVLRDTDDKILASGELSQRASGNRVTSQLVFHFGDGSLHEETTVFSQRKVFQLVSYHLVQRGKSFKRATDMRINAATGLVTVISADDDGKEKTYSETMKLPPDLANGLSMTLVKDIDPKALKTTISMVASTPKPRLVKLVIEPEDVEDSFSVAGAPRKALHYTVKVDIGGIGGVVAPIVGKQPPDTHVWLVGGKSPGFLKSEGPLSDGGPVWKIELASPVWPKAASSH
jgi:hypothetical protein